MAKRKSFKCEVETAMIVDGRDVEGVFKVLEDFDFSETLKDMFV
jgi:hypothetical protein